MLQRNTLFPLKTNSCLRFLPIYVVKHVLDGVSLFLLGLSLQQTLVKLTNLSPQKIY